MADPNQPLPYVGGAGMVGAVDAFTKFLADKRESELKANAVLQQRQQQQFQDQLDVQKAQALIDEGARQTAGTASEIQLRGATADLENRKFTQEQADQASLADAWKRFSANQNDMGARSQIESLSKGGVNFANVVVPPEKVTTYEPKSPYVQLTNAGLAKLPPGTSPVVQATQTYDPKGALHTKVGDVELDSLHDYKPVEPTPDPYLEDVRRAAADKAALLGQYDIGTAVKTMTRSQQKYLNLNEVPTELQSSAVVKAQQQNIPVIKDPAEAQKLRDIQISEENQDAMWKQISPILAKNGLTRAQDWVGVKLSTLSQTNDIYAAYDAWQTQAVQTFKTLAGGQGSGIRMTQAELDRAIQNNIPRTTDDLATAARKMSNIATQLRIVEDTILRRSGGTGPNAPAAPASAPARPSNVVPGLRTAPAPGDVIDARTVKID